MVSEGLLTGHTVLVTGASKGIGKAISTGFAEQGAGLVLVARKKENMAEVADACRAAGSGSVELYEMDAGSKESVTALAKAMEGKGVSVLVNNAGVVASFGRPPLEADVEDWDTMLAVNLAAPMRLVRLLGPGMVGERDPVILNISSISGVDPVPNSAGYATSKWGLTGFGESIAQALQGKIRVVTIFPGFVATPMTEAVDFISADDMITPKDIVEAALLPFRMTSRACPTNIVGIGKAISIGFAEQGADVILVARKKENMAEVAEACKAAGSSSVELHEMDASSKESVVALASAVEGKVSVLVNNAGVLTGLGVPPLENDPDEWDTMLAVNLAAPMRLVRLLGPGMAEKGNGVIINISSVAGLDPKPLVSGYATSKWGLTGFSESIAEALKGKIRVMTIFPAMVVTEMTKGMVDRLRPEEMITTQDIMEAALLPFRMSSKACPTRVVIQNTTKARG